MKKTTMFGAMAAAALLAGGCSSVQTASTVDLNGMPVTASGTTVAHVSANNCGLYLLWIPLITGDCHNAGGFAFLGEDSVSAPAVTNLVTRKAKSLGATKTLDLVSTNASSGFIFYWKSSWVSGNAVR